MSATSNPQTTDAFAALLRHPQLARYAFSAVPVWLWTPDGTRVLWANAVAAELFGSSRPEELTRRGRDAHDPATREVQRLRATLPASGAIQLARLRGFSRGLPGILTCASCRVPLPSGSGAILIVGTQPVRPVMPLLERARRMLGEADDTLVFSSDGALLYAGALATNRLAGRASLAALGAGGLAANALNTGWAEGTSALGQLKVEKLGGGDAIVLRATPHENAADGDQHTNRDIRRDDLHAADVFVRPDQPPATPAPSEKRRRDDDALASYLVAALDDAEMRLVERRHPLRFVWRMDAAGRFSIESGDFTALAGASTAAVMRRPWPEVALALGLDPEGQVLRAVASRDTWSGTTVEWPAEGSALRLPVVLSGLPVLTRERTFNGYRGFGVCRDVRAITAAIAARREALARTQPMDASADAPPDPEGATPGRQRPVLAPPARYEPPVFDTPASSAERPRLTVVPTSRKVVPLRPGAPAERPPPLSSVERNAFQEIARTLGATPGRGDPPPPAEAGDPKEISEFVHWGSDQPLPELPHPLERGVLERLPFGILLYRGDDLVFANRALLEWTGHADLDAVQAAGGMAALFTDPPPLPAGAETPERPQQAMSLRGPAGETLAVDAQVLSLPPGQGAVLLLSRRSAQERAQAELAAAREQARELKSILDTAADGIVVVDAEGCIVAANLSAEALFGYEGADFVSLRFAELFAPESQRIADEYFAGLNRASVASLFNDGREVIGRVRQGGLVPLFMTMGRISDAPAKFCAVFRDLTAWKRAAEDLHATKRAAAQAASAKSDFLSRLNHELRTPLNTIIGFAELMMRERLGPLGDERYRSYMTDIHACGTQVITLLDDLTSLSKVEQGRLELAFTKVDLNEAIGQCVAATQQQANRERIIIRTALSTTAPSVVADAPSLRKIVLNLISNSIKFTDAGGQVIVSTALTDAGEAVIRVRDTGIGMSETQIAQVLEPFAPLQMDVAAQPNGASLGLPLTKALVEANRASFHIKSAPNAGTLVEIVFPAARVLTE